MGEDITIRAPSGTLTLSADPPTIIVGVASGAALVYAGAKMMVTPPGPEPGYHLTHQLGDLIGGGILVTVGVAAIYAGARAFRYSRRVL